MAKSAAKISIALEAQTASLKQGFAEAKGAINQLDSNMSMSVAKGMAAFTAGLAAVQGALASVRAGFQAVLETMDKLGRQQMVAEKVGMSADSVTALGLAASHAYGDVDKLHDVLKDMTERISEAGTMGTGEAVEVMAELGLSAERLNQLSGEQKLGALADALKEITNEGDRTRIAIRLFGDQGYELLQIFKDGSAGLNAYAQEAAKLGLLVGDQGETIDAATGAITRLKAAWGGMVAQIAIAVAPALTAVANLITSIVAAFNSLIGKADVVPASFSGGLEKARVRADEMTDEMKKEMEKTAADAEREAEAIASRGEALAKSLRDPAEIFADTMMELDDLVKAGAISWTIYQRGIRKAVEELHKGKEAADWTTPGIAALTRGSGAAFTATQENSRAKADADRKHAEHMARLDRLERTMREHSITLAPVHL